MTKFASRKFTVIVATLGLTTVLALAGHFDGNVALVFGTCVTAYQVGQAWLDGKK